MLCGGGAPLPADSQQDHAEQAEEEGQAGQVVLHPHHQETGSQAHAHPLKDHHQNFKFF